MSDDLKRPDAKGSGEFAEWFDREFAPPEAGAAAVDVDGRETETDDAPEVDPSDPTPPEAVASSEEADPDRGEGAAPEPGTPLATGIAERVTQWTDDDRFPAGNIGQVRAGSHNRRDLQSLGNDRRVTARAADLGNETEHEVGGVKANEFTILVMNCCTCGRTDFFKTASIQQLVDPFPNG